jgi:hypothetical protein
LDCYSLSLLALVAIYTQDQRLNATSWYQPIEVTIFQINGDGNAKTEHYIQQLSSENFQDIDAFFIRKAK